MRARAMSNKQVAEAVRLYETGEGLVAIGKRLNVHFSTVAGYLREIGVKMRPRGAPKGSRGKYVALRAEALRRVRAGETQRAVEIALGVGAGVVSRWCKRAGLRRVSRAVRIVDEAVTLINRTQGVARTPRDLVLELRARGVPSKSIAADLGLHVTTVYRWLGEARRQRDERIVTMLADGVPVVAIAEAFGVSRAYVSLLGADRKERAA